MFQNTLASIHTQATAAGTVARIARRTALAGALAAALVAAFIAPLGAAAVPAHTLAPIASHATLAVSPDWGCAGAPTPC